MKLRFNPELCLNCSTYSCLTKCINLNYDFEMAGEERKKIALGEYSRVLEECYTCYGCEEYCEYGNHPFYSIVELQESLGVKRVSDETKKALLQRYDVDEVFTPKKVGGKFVHICLFPEVKDLVKGKLFEGYEVIRGRHIFCNMIYLHYGMVSVIKERAERTVNNIMKLEPEELVLYHDECYAFYKSFAEAYGIEVPFSFTHLFDFLYDRLREMDVKELGIRVAYQRNCSNRLIPETDRTLDRIFELIGVERVEREYDRERAICCGAPFVISKEPEKAEDLQSKNIRDILETRAEYVAFNCPMCYTTLADKVRAKGLKPVMVSELCRMAVGEVEY